jgi:hypothetical protein
VYYCGRGAKSSIGRTLQAQCVKNRWLMVSWFDKYEFGSDLEGQSIRLEKEFIH